ncbi:phytanoyl-CoA dioxygenase family protein [Streptomyces sp. SL13]|jgi:ectoine hydroxylase-related dioxygenase (phytanoyl-CoA dioxygenase family)|uniref:Phytanoyl-CoA dioxygenase family protein n=1 Tax=Streptantibioticus silvisoli TaxID=2705255 RepID=A0AA90H7Z4_9ACTN|nr:phytanoyl-CoA dioxygenase family protein [Streptantibioticus silvisoli]MDI5966017.1 phytanoyl-CoA dioxygenase family protein [Streptantibioticus silvisoli]MDI5973581.1 phytanoyl-CoA dioxygenase family protein [Streptantibioticus silvisoli]
MNGYSGLSSEEIALLPTDEDVRNWSERGWYLSGKLLTDEEADAMTEASKRFYAGQEDRPLAMNPPRLDDWKPSHGEIQRKTDYIHYRDKTFAEILRKPIIGAVAARLAQASRISVFQTTMVYKPPVAEETSNIVSWHFDKYYWPTSTSENMLTAFIPFHDCTEEFGTVTMVSGSHRWNSRHGTVRPPITEGDRRREYVLEEDAARNGVAVPEKAVINIPKGHMSFHHCLLYHGSGPNVSGVPRRAVTLHMQDETNGYRDWRQSDGLQQDYKHDYLVRRTPEGLPDYTDPEFFPQIWPVPGDSAS